MSTGRSNALDALPRASFLTYFQTPSQPKRRTSDDNQKGRPSCKAPCSQAAPLSRILEDTTAEEDTDKESILGDCKHSDHCESDEQSEHESSWSKMLSFTGYTLLVLLIMLNLDFLLSAYNVNAGVVKWDSRRTIAGSSSREVSDHYRCGRYSANCLTRCTSVLPNRTVLPQRPAYGATFPENQAQAGQRES
jgi:hypothetical protein